MYNTSERTKKLAMQGDLVFKGRCRHHPFYSIDVAVSRLFTLFHACFTADSRLFAADSRLFGPERAMAGRRRFSAKKARAAGLLVV